MQEDDDPLLGGYLDEWLDRRRSQLRPLTLHGYRQTVDCYLWPHLGDQPGVEGRPARRAAGAQPGSARADAQA